MGAGTFQKVVRLGLKNQRCRREDRGAKGAEEGRVWIGGVPLPIRLGGLVELRELPQLGPGRSPSRQRIFAYFSATERCWWR